ncbi:MAG: DUF563 domain-containing protein [Solobacterium sp.]|nr:DUF563 domain-containing protein [Solobacterium sp.]
MKRLALRGYGNHGRDMELILSESRQNAFQVTDVYDIDYEKTGNTEFLGLPVRSPDALEEDYRAGLFDEVLVTVYEPRVNRRIADDLLAKGIPVCREVQHNVMAEPETFPLAEEVQTYPEKGYRRFCYSNVYLHVTKRHCIPFVFDQAGRINKAYWRDYQLKLMPYGMYYQPDPGMPCRDLAGEWALLTGLLSNNYWHFTYETIDKVHLLEKHGFRGKYLLAKPAFAPALMRLAGVEEDRIVWLEDLDPSINYRPERLVCPVLGDDPFHDIVEVRDAAPVLAEYAESVRRKLMIDGDYPARIYVKRIGKRRLKVSQEWLDQHGFRTIVPEELSVEEQIRHFMHADIVLSPHGANSTNSLYMKKGSVLIETFPTNYIYPCCIETCEERDIHYLMVTGYRHHGYTSENTEETYTVVERALDSAVRAAEKLTAADE